MWNEIKGFGKLNLRKYTSILLLSQGDFYTTRRAIINYCQ